MDVRIQVVWFPSCWFAMFWYLLEEWNLVIYIICRKIYKMPLLLAEVKYRKITFFTNCWTHIFGLNNTFASRTGFWVIDFMISIQNHTVTFLGCYENYGGVECYFASEFIFFNSSDSVRVRSIEWKKQENFSILLMERLFHQADDGLTYGLIDEETQSQFVEL